MPTTFKSLPLFPGPHRFAVLKQGQLLIPAVQVNFYSPQTFAQGLHELQAQIRGRLIAASESALWTLRDAITAQLLHPPTPGTLIDEHGRTWTDMSFVEYLEGEPTDRARAWSIAYTALFRRMIDPFTQL